jgi:hypothetical protein
MSKERDDLKSVVMTLKAFADRPANSGGTVLVEKVRLLALAATIERSLAVNVWEQSPSWREWKEQVADTRCHKLDFNAAGACRGQLGHEGPCYNR